jgi:hypothetical protein
MRLSIAILVLASTYSCGLGCDEFASGTCGQPPAERLLSFDVTITTGDEPTDANIAFCFARKSADAWECTNLDSILDNDFEVGEVDQFNVEASPWVEAGDLRRMRIVNKGGGFFGESGWEVAALRITGNFEQSGAVTLYDEPAIECGNRLSDGDTYEPPCAF